MREVAGEKKSAQPLQIFPINAKYKVNRRSGNLNLVSRKIRFHVFPMQKNNEVKSFSNIIYESCGPRS